jgi:ArsR family transcriptional regulator
MEKDYERFTQIFKAIADETRLQIVTMLSGGELCACDILESFEITQPTLSYHMKILCDSGLVDGRRDGAWMRYNLKKDSFEAIRELFDNIGTGQIMIDKIIKGKSDNLCCKKI